MNTQSRGTPAGRRRRRAYGLVEVGMAVMLVMAAMSLMVKALGVVANERREADRRLWAVEAASNVLERVSAEPFDGITRKIVDEIAAGVHAERVLPGATWESAVEDDRGAPVPAKKVSLRLHWNDRSKGPGAPVRLTTWVYRKGGRS